jgi:MFS family permease
LNAAPNPYEEAVQKEPGIGRWWMVALLFGAFALSYVDRQAAYSFFPVLKRSLGFSDTQLGLVASLFVWSYALTMPIAGRIADVVRRDRLVIASLVLWSMATLGTALSHSPIVFLGWRVVMGITESLYFPAAVGMIAVLHPGNSRSRALGIHQIAQLMGIIAGGWYGGWTAEHIGWRAGFGVLCAVGICYSLTLFGIFRRARLGSRPADATQWNGLGGLLRSPLYLLLSLAFFWLCAVVWIVYAWLPNFLYNRFRLSLSTSGLDATLYIQISCGVGVLGGGWLADRLVSRIPAIRLYVFGCGLMLCAPCAFAVFASSTLGEFRLWSVLFGILSGTAIANIFAGAYDVVPDQGYGLVAGMLNLIGGLSGGAATLVVGLYRNSIGTMDLTGCVAALAVVAAVVLLLGTRRLFRVPQTELQTVTDQV